MAVAPQRVYNLSDDFCIVVEFQNENNSVAAGYASWTRIDYKREELVEIQNSDKLIEIYWPNEDFNTGKKLKTFIRRLSVDQWSIHVVKILAVSDWKGANSMVNLKASTGVLSTTKQNRHQHMKKHLSSSEDDDELTINEANKIEKKKSRAANKTLKQTRFERNCQKVDELEKILEKKQSWTDALDDYDSDDDIVLNQNAGKDQLKTRIQILEIENKNLRTELAHYKNVVLYDEKVQKLNALLQTADYLIQRGQLCSKCRKRKITDFDNESTEKHPIKKPRNESDFQTPSTASSSNNFMGQMSPIDSESDESNDFPPQSTVEKSTEKKNEKVTPDGLKESVNHGEQMNQVEQVDPVLPELAPNQPRVEASVRDENMMELSHGIKIPKTIYGDKIRKTDSRKFMLDMIHALFEETELATHSRSGRKGLKLDENKINAIKDTAKQVFPNEHSSIDTSLNQMIVNQCKNAKRGKAQKGEEKKD